MTVTPEKQWRIDNASHLRGLRLLLQHYTRWSERWDHDHCAACWAKFAEFDDANILHEGYATCDEYPHGARYEWVCQTCFDDLKDDMEWSAVEDGHDLSVTAKRSRASIGEAAERETAGDNSGVVPDEERDS